MNRLEFLKAMALSPLLLAFKGVEMVAGPTLADKIRLEEPPPIEEEHDDDPWWLAPYPLCVLLNGRDGSEFRINAETRDGILYLWQ